MLSPPFFPVSLWTKGFVLYIARQASDFCGVLSFLLNRNCFFAVCCGLFVLLHFAVRHRQYQLGNAKPRSRLGRFRVYMKYISRTRMIYFEVYVYI